MNFPKKRIWDFKSHLRIGEQSPYRLSGLEELLALTQSRKCCLTMMFAVIQLIIDISFDIIFAFFAIHSWSYCFRSTNMR